MHSKTFEHLTTAMEAEAYSSAKCSRFAAHARTQEKHELAWLFQEMADADRCNHFQKQFTAANLLGGDHFNVSAAIDEKQKQIDMYAAFEAAAIADGDHEAAVLFAGLHTDERKQLEKFQLAVKMLNSRNSLTFNQENGDITTAVQAKD